MSCSHKPNLGFGFCISISSGFWTWVLSFIRAYMFVNLCFIVLLKVVWLVFVLYVPSKNT